MTADDPRPRLAYDRTVLANERTFAAWVRTGLSIVALGLGIAHVVPEPDHNRWAPVVLGALFILTGVVTLAFGAWRFARVSRDLEGWCSPAAPVAPRVIYAIALILAALLGGVLWLL